MDAITNVATAAGLAWASGIRLYAVLFFTGILGRLGYVQLPEALQVLQHPLVLGTTGVLFVVEFCADKIPALDSVWDAVHTFIRIPGGALLAAYAIGSHDPAAMLAAGIVGGTLAAGTHFAKAGTRAAINTSPEPVTNWAASITEDVVVFGGLLTAFFHSTTFLVLLAFFVLLLIWLLPKVWRFVRGVLRRIGTVAV